ncbi:MAG: hypothetical protein J0H68_03370 [Sphingobacteriia bacterium]|nr:hypothetical protein [Sphingobacteriia bacterium]
MKRSLEIFSYYLTKAFDSVIDNYYISYYFPKSLDLAIYLRVVRNGTDISNYSRYELAEGLGYPNHAKIEYNNLPSVVEIEKAKLNGNMLDAIISIAQNPKKYLLSSQDPIFGNNTYLPLKEKVYLSECACIHSDNFNRLANERRQNIENQIINDSIIHFSKETPIHYLGFGSGRLLGELFIVARLIKAGYKNLNLNFIDNEYYEENESLAIFKEILETIVSQEKISINIAFYSDLTSYRVNSSENPNIITAIDFDDKDKMFDQLMELHDILSSNGLFYLSYSDYDLSFNKQGCLTFNTKDHSTPLFLKNISDQIENIVGNVQNENNEPIRIAALTNEFEVLHRYYLFTSLFNPSKKIELTLLKPKEKDYFGSNTKKNNKAYTEENLAKFIKLLRSNGGELSVIFIEDFDDFRKQNIQSITNYNIILHLGSKSNFAEEQIEQIKWLTYTFPNATHYYMVLIYNSKTRNINFQHIWKWDQVSGVISLESKEILSIGAEQYLHKFYPSIDKNSKRFEIENEDKSENKNHEINK